MAKRYVKAEDYPEVARRVVKEMHRQVGVLKMDARTGLARRGLLVRHLVMPDNTAGTREIMLLRAEGGDGGEGGLLPRILGHAGRDAGCGQAPRSAR